MTYAELQDKIHQWDISRPWPKYANIVGWGAMVYTGLALVYAVLEVAKVVPTPK